jgi:hypothetical protein
MGIYQGGVIDMSSFVAQPIPHSTAESETIAISLGAMACAYARMGIADILFDNPNRPWTIPMISDSSAAIAMNTNDKPTRRNRHIDRRYFYGREEYTASKLTYHHIDADHSLADLGTKNLTAEEAAYKLSIVEYPVSDHHIGSKAIKKSSDYIVSKKGDDDEDHEMLTKLTKLTTPVTYATANHMYRMDNEAMVSHEELCGRRHDVILEDSSNCYCSNIQHASKDRPWATSQTERNKDWMDSSLCSEFQIVDNL